MIILAAELIEGMLKQAINSKYVACQTAKHWDLPIVENFLSNLSLSNATQVFWQNRAIALS